MTNLEWMQRQHYESFKKLLVDDPYNAIFGSSNARLGGKGLTDWEWINKTFPKWMLSEMESPEEPKQGKDTTSGSEYPKKVDTRSEDAGTPKKESHFPQPSYKTTRMDRHNSSGIVSPSDLRRSHEQSDVKIFGRPTEADTSSIFNPKDKASTSSSSPPPTRPKNTAQFGEFIAKTTSDATNEMEMANKAAAATKPSFKDKFSTEKPHEPDWLTPDTERHTCWSLGVPRRANAMTEEMEKANEAAVAPKPSFKGRFLTDQLHEPDWILPDPNARYTCWSLGLPERASPTFAVELDTAPASVTKLYEEVPNTGGDILDILHGKDAEAKTPAPVATASGETNNATKFTKSESSNKREGGMSQDSTTPVRSTSKILNQLPEDDIDFLSADAIRATMAAKKSKLFKNEQKEAERKNLEKTFEDVHKTDAAAIDAMIESKVINDQHVRRIERQMRESQETQDADETSKAAGMESTAILTEDGRLELSVERMKSFWERGGARFSRVFWQDPAEDPEVEKTRVFFDKTMARIQKGRLTMKQVVQDLETDVPASKPLLKRMKADEDLLDSAIHALRQRSGSGKFQPLTPMKTRAIFQLRKKYRDTDSELDAAYDTLRELGKSDVLKRVSSAFKRRLAIAAKITQKNAHLTRYLIWSLQARFEDPNVDSSTLPNYKAVGNILLTLRDTQNALSRLIDRAMLMYGVVPKQVAEFDFSGQEHNIKESTQFAPTSLPQGSSGMSEVDRTQLRTKIAAKERLANEVNAQKSAMQGLSDDGYARAPKSVAHNSYVERGPLAHSLFRPFGPVLEGLGSGIAADAEAKKAEDDAAQKRSDATLIAEVKAAYEETYGPITVGHKQLVDAGEEVKKEQENGVRKFDMLKDDPSSEVVADPAKAKTDEVTVQSHGRPGLRFEDMFGLDGDISSHLYYDAVAAQQRYARHPLRVIDIEANNMSDVPKYSTKSFSPLLVEAQKARDVDQDSVPATQTPESTVQVKNASNKATAEATSSPPPAAAATQTPEAISQVDEALRNHHIGTNSSPPITYWIYRHNTLKDKLELSIEAYPSARAWSRHSTMPLHEALENLDEPAKFVPLIRPGFEIVTATHDMLVLREAVSSTPRRFETDTTINPIDGTARLSPTGYASPQESQERLREEFEERREMARAFCRAKSVKRAFDEGQEKARKKGGRGAGVIKTAIWAVAGCYVVGVLGELASGV
jgi:hypothetical protein